MPERRYIPMKPPTMLDRIGAHWAELGIALLGLLQAVSAAFIRGPGVAVVELPNWQAGGVAGFMFVGSALWVWTVVHRFEKLSDLLKWQRIGLGFAGLAWLAFGSAGAIYRPHVVSVWLGSLTLAVAVWGLFFLSWVYERRVHTITSPTS